MSMMNIFNVSGSAASAQSQRLNVVASNLANADTVAGPDGQAYKARQVTFQTQLMGANGNDPTAAGVKVSTISEDQTVGRRVHDPKHPGADADGYVTYSNVNPIEEMVNMISASRSYQNNIKVMAGREQQRGFLAVQIGQFDLQLHHRVMGAGDVAGAAGAGADTGRGLDHGADHLGVLAHAEIVVGAPDHDVALAFRRVPDRMRKAACDPFEVGEHPVAPLVMQAVEGGGEEFAVIHHKT